MIGEIKALSSFGVFNNYTLPATGQLLRYNLFYGWNGSGKTTLSRAFSTFSGTAHAVFPNGNFKVAIGTADFTRENVVSSGIKIEVFNQDFVKRNLDFENHRAKSILYISEEKIEERKKLITKQEELKVAKESLRQKNEELNKVTNEISTDQSKIAKNIKGSFGLIQTQNTKFLNYDKKKLETFITSNQSKISDSNILTAEELNKTQMAAQSTQKTSLEKINIEIDIKEIAESLAKFRTSVEKSIVAARIEKLLEDTEVNKWVEAGLGLHKKKLVKDCSFCGNNVSPERIADLEKHFSTEYQETITNLGLYITEIEDIENKIGIILHDNGDFYSEFQDNVRDLKLKIEAHKKELGENLTKVKSQLQSKKDNPFEKIFWDEGNIQSKIAEFLSFIEELNKTVEQHNIKTTNFLKSVNEANEKLELHFVCDQLQDGALVTKKKKLNEVNGEVDTLTKNETALSEEVRKLEGQLVNAAIASGVFNSELERFLGRSDISLEFKPDQGGYLFMRNGRREAASNLSEGEKTAIAFIYFVTKLSESGGLISDTIIVLDDPISSFDSNHLHHSFGFIRKHLDSCKQLVVLTHNFEFFKLIRDWMKKKNSSDEPNKNKSKFFFVQAGNEAVRQSVIVQLPDVLLNYESEYHFIFGKILSCKDKTNLSFEDAHFVGNCARKVLEAFLSFKFPSHKADFANLLEKACGADKNLFHKVYSFINKYSHSRNLEVLATGSDNLFSESQNIVSDVMGIIKNLDESHFTEMSKLHGVQ